MRLTTLKSILVASTVLATACGSLPLEKKKDSGSKEPPRTPINVGSRACPSNSILSYENFGEPFMLSHCTGCHSSALDGSGPAPGNRQGATIGVDFDTYDLVRQFGSQIFAYAADGSAIMPPKDNIPVDNPISVDDRTALGDWLACDAPLEADLPN